MNKTHQDMRKSHVVSIFIGNVISTESEMDRYLREEFSQDFGFEIYPPAGPEYAQGDVKSLEELLTGFSGSASFKEKALEIAKEKNIDQVKSALVFYGFDYDTTLINPNGTGKLEFLGTIEQVR